MAVLFVSFLILFVSCQAKYLHEPLTKEVIDYINSFASWKADPDYAGYNVEHLKKLCGVPLDGNVPPRPKRLGILPERTDYEEVELPDSFDARQRWPECKSISEIRDQGTCGSCWAVASVEAMTDRICIHSGGKLTPHLSTEDVLSCCNNCGYGCAGGSGEKSWKFWQENGIVTGGQYNSKQGCQPYKVPACDHYIKGHLKPCEDVFSPQALILTPACEKRCEAGYNVSYSNDKQYGKSVYRVGTDAKKIAIEIMTNGPVQADFTVYTDFFSYKSGVYQHTFGKPKGAHAIKILGWGTEGRKPYWLVANSWNTDWGDKGFFKILRGGDECGIESGVLAGLPKL